MHRHEDINLYLKGILNSYSQVFFSDNRVFALVLLLVTFIDVNAGAMGLLSVLVTNLAGFLMGFERKTLSRGMYGFNSLLVGLALGVYFRPGALLVLVVLLGAVLTLLISVSMQGVIGKYYLPFLSIPFLFSVWIMTLATRDFTALGVSERGIYTFNDLYLLGGKPLVVLYDWWNSLDLARSLRTYLISLGAILFQYNVLSGIILALGLLYYSRISFTLSLLGFYTAYVFYELIGASISDLSYSYIGFNYILTSIAVGGFFVIPSVRSYLWVIVLIPIVALITISLSGILMVLSLPVYSLPFNIVVLLFLYALKFRTTPSAGLSEVYIQQNSPEKNLYSWHNHMLRFREEGRTSVKLPFLGKWTVSQGHSGELTHRDEYRHAWDFVITDLEGSQFSGKGDYPEDYYCFNKPVLAPADGEVEFVVDDIEDNIIGEVNVRENWGNTVVLRHSEGLFSSLSHLKKGSVPVEEGDRVRTGDIIASCGNSGRSPYPHLHFQLQATPYIGSTTIEYPIAHYMSHAVISGDSAAGGSSARAGSPGGRFRLKSYEMPVENELVSNIEKSELLLNAFHFIPGKRFEFEVSGSGENVEWEVQTDSYNNTCIHCSGSGSTAWFRHDGDLLYFTHFEGNKTSLLYYFFLSAFKLQMGYYEGLVVEDRYPLNLLFGFPLLSLQDFTAPVWKFLSSDYRLRYAAVDSDIAPSEMVLESLASSRILKREVNHLEFIIRLDLTGIRQLEVSCAKFDLKAKCTGT